jgi:hypothetical protein
MGLLWSRSIYSAKTQSIESYAMLKAKQEKGKDPVTTKIT